MSIIVVKGGRKVIVRTALTFYTDRDQGLVDILQETERAGGSVAAVIVELMRTGLPGGAAAFEAEEDGEMVDLSQLAMFDEGEE